MVRFLRLQGAQSAERTCQGRAPHLGAQGRCRPVPSRALGALIVTPCISIGLGETVGWRGDGNDSGAGRTGLRSAGLRKACSVRLRR